MQIRATAESDESHPSAMEMESKRTEPTKPTKRNDGEAKVLQYYFRKVQFFVESRRVKLKSVLHQMSKNKAWHTCGGTLDWLFHVKFEKCILSLKRATDW